MKVKWRAIAAAAQYEGNMRDAFALTLDAKPLLTLRKDEQLVDLLPEERWFAAPSQEGLRADRLRRWLWDNNEEIRKVRDEAVIVWFASLEGKWYGGLAAIKVGVVKDGRVLVGKEVADAA